MERPRLEVDIYQIIDDALLKANRTDGTGWDWGWADWQRDWMSATPNRHAYRCLPLTIANQTGWWIRNPVGFSARWRGTNEPGSIDFRFDEAGEFWKDWINSQFGEGIVTWNTPFLFRTRPHGSRLLICGPANSFKKGAHPLTAIIESDWMSMSFTMNWKLMASEEPVRFDVGEPLFQAIPLISNVCADLEEASVTYRRLIDDPEMTRAYNDWHLSRKRFHDLKARGDVKPDDWQKDYFRGRDVTGRETAPDHMTKVKPPLVQVVATTPPSRSGDDLAPNTPTPVRAMQQPKLRVTESKVAPADRQPDAPGPVLDRDGARRPHPQSAQDVGRAAAGAPGDRAAPRKVDDEWRRWIAENLMLDSTADSMLDAMAAAGIPREEAAREIELARNSPYVRGSEHLRDRLKKRDWLLAVYRKINRLHPRSGEIERRHRLSRADFLAEYYSTSRPVILTGMMDDWPAMRKWDLDYFAEKFGDREVEVQTGRTAGDNYEIEREKYISRIRMSEFVEKVRDAGVTNDFYLTANNTSNNKKALPELWDDIVQVPEYLDGRDRPGGFLWIGPPGTITPFHHDLTNNFMAQVIGRKRVKVVPSWDLPLMDNYFHCYSRIDGRALPPRPQAGPGEAQVLECILGPGEILFLPVGCMHFVEGIDVSVTVSFTNFVFDNDFSSFYTTYHGV